MAQSKFSRVVDIAFKDTRGAGVIVVRGIELQSDEDGFVEGPAELEREIAPHGFIPVEKWMAGMTSAERMRVLRKFPRFEKFATGQERIALAKKDIGKGGE